MHEFAVEELAGQCILTLPRITWYDAGPWLAIFPGKVCCQAETELRKVAILAIRIGERSGNLGNIFTRHLRRFVKFWDMSRFTHF